MTSEQQPNRRNLLWRGLAAGVGSFLLLAVLLFAPAGTFDFWQAWVYLALYAIYLFPGSVYWCRVDPDYVERRLKFGAGSETNRNQKWIMAALTVVTCSWFVIPGFDHRFGWSDVPLYAVIIAIGLVVLGMVIVYLTAIYNRFSAATITVEENQPVISTGPYAWVRHPMYSGVSLWCTATPVALGSWWGLVVVFPLYAVLYLRIVGEERYLREHLPGYTEYCQKVKYRLIPFVF